MKIRPVSLIAAVLFTVCGAVSAQVPGLSVSFTDRVGVVGPNDPIDIWLTVSLDPGAAALDFDGESPGTSFGVPPEILPVEGWNGSDYVPFAEYTSAVTTVAYLCSGTFWPCGDAPYTFAFDGGVSSFLFKSLWSIAPGESQQYLFGRFTPDGAPVAPGTYRFYTAYLWLDVNGLDANGAPLSGTAYLASTCINGDDACAFTRTVEVPEPQTYALLGIGLLAVGWATRHGRRSKS